MPSPFDSQHVFTRSIAHASSMVALGIPLRPEMPVTVTKEAGKEDILFWFEPGSVTVEGLALPAREWLRLLMCPWSDFKVSLEHPVAYLRAASENRQVLLAGVKTAQGRPFQVFKNGNRTVVIGAGVSEQSARRLLSQ